MFRCPTIEPFYLIAQKKFARSSDRADRQGGKPFRISKKRTLDSWANFAATPDVSCPVVSTMTRTPA